MNEIGGGMGGEETQNNYRHKSNKTHRFKMIQYSVLQTS